MKPALASGCRSEIHRSNQSIQYTATAYVAMLQGHKIAVSKINMREAWQNGFSEWLIRTIREEEVNSSGYQDYADSYRQIGQFLEDVYSHKRIHLALGYLAPIEFETRWQAQQLTPEGVH